MTENENFETNAPEETGKLETARLPKWTTLKLIIGVLMMVFFIMIAFQSCAAGLYNMLSDNGESSGMFGLVSGLLLVSAGIVGVATRKSAKRGGALAVTVMTWLVFLFSRIGAGTYTDLQVWGILAFVAGCIYLFSVMRTKKGNIIAAIVSAIYLIAGLI